MRGRFGPEVVDVDFLLEAIRSGHPHWAELTHRLRDLCDRADMAAATINGALEAALIESAVSAVRLTPNGSVGPDKEPIALCTSWREITEALSLGYDAQNKVKSLNDRLDGPIPKPPIHRFSRRTAAEVVG